MSLFKIPFREKPWMVNGSREIGRKVVGVQREVNPSLL